MPDLKHYTPPQILWIDLEMTGLNPAKDRILEVAAIVTDWHFNELETFESGVGHDANEVRQLLQANEFYATYPQNQQALLQLSSQSPPSKNVEDQLLALVERHFNGEVALLAGNSIHIDRSFIRQWWPRLESRLHYRMLDVTAWKVVMDGRFKVGFSKQETHRALGDIRESISELQYYLEWFGASHANA